ncbi:hypothetical protein CF327_g3507 [Tilletia walkeri]|nr:hypothetical protein CF327_g3507 [Tilletia walkeri]
MSPSTPATSTSAGPRLTTVPINIRAACESCRTRKLKCSGQPVDAAMQATNIVAGGPDAVNKCARCAKEGTECLFASRAPIGRPKKRKSEDGTDLPSSTRRSSSAAPGTDPASAQASSSSSTSKPRQRKTPGPARKRSKKDPPQTDQSIQQFDPQQNQLVANAAAAAAAAIAMGADTAAYVDGNGDSIPNSNLNGFTDVSSPAAAASTLLDFRYQQQSAHPTTSMGPYPATRYQTAPPGPPPPFANAGPSAAEDSFTHSNMNGNDSPAEDWQMDPQLQRDFRERQQRGLHRIPGPPDFDPGPPPPAADPSTSQFVHPSSRLHSHFVPLPPDQTPSSAFHSLPSETTTPQSMSRPRNLPGLYEQSISNSPSYSSLGLQTPATEISLLNSSSGLGPNLNSLSLAAFLSSLDTLSLTASDGLTPAMLDSSSLGGSLGAPMPVSSSSATAQPDNTASMPRDQIANGSNQGFVLGSALFTDVSQNQRALFAFNSATPSGPVIAANFVSDMVSQPGQSASQHASMFMQGNSDPSTALHGDMVPGHGQQGQRDLLPEANQPEANQGAAVPTSQPMAVTATTEELAGLSYALPADFKWWDDFFSKGPLISGGAKQPVVTAAAAAPQDPQATTVGAEGETSVEGHVEQSDRANKTKEGARNDDSATDQPPAKKDCCQPKSSSPSQPSAYATTADEGVKPAGSCCGPKTPLLGTSVTEQSSPVAEHNKPARSERAGTVHCVPDPKGEGCTCLCNAEVALLSVRRVLKRTEAIPLNEEMLSTGSGRIERPFRSNAVATTLHLTLSASQAVSAQCACSADCPTCREDGGMMMGPSSSSKRGLDSGEVGAGAGVGASPRIVSASLLVSTALQIYARAVKMLRETLARAAPPGLLEPAQLREEEGSGGDVSEVVLGKKRMVEDGPGNGVSGPTPEAWSCAHPGHSLTLSAADRGRDGASSGSSSRTSTGMDSSGALVPPESPPPSCCGTSITSTGVTTAVGSGSGCSTHHHTPGGGGSKGGSTPELDIDIKIGNTYRPLPHNARRIALFAMKLELRDLQEALRKVAVLAQADGVMGWPEGERETIEGGDGKAESSLAITAPTLNPIDRMVINKLHAQLGELLNTVESLEQW